MKEPFSRHWKYVENVMTMKIWRVTRPTDPFATKNPIRRGDKTVWIFVATVIIFGTIKVTTTALFHLTVSLGWSSQLPNVINNNDEF